MKRPAIATGDVESRLPEGNGAAAHILDSAPLPVLLVGRDGKVRYENKALLDLLAMSQNSGRSFAELIHEPDRTGVLLQLERLARGEVASWRGEVRFTHANGSPLWTFLAASAVSQSGGDQPLIMVQLVDIDLQKKAEAALLYAEARWNSALESAGQGVWDYDMRRDRMFYSRMWRVMRHIPEDEDVGGEHDSEWFDRMHPDDVPRMKEIAHRQGQGEEGHDTLEYRERRRDGRYIWILSRGRPIEWDENGKVLRAVGTDTDITHIKTVELELAAEKERLRVTLESIADGMISADAKGNVEFMNATAEQLTGLSLEAARGRPVREVFRLRNETTGLLMDCPVWSCFEEGRPVRLDDDGVLLSSDGSARDVRCTAAPVQTDSGNIVGAVLVFQDVTQNRAMQRQLAHSASHDALTGLTNRAAFERMLDRVARASRTSDQTSCLIYVDLDYFKPVNDNAGHAAGDALLRQVAQTIRECCRSHDVVARIGGDEFAVIVEGTSIATGRAVATKIVRAIGSLVFQWGGRDYRIGASAGLTLISRDAPTALGHMGEADAACYAAKAAGRNRVVAFVDMGEKAQP